VLRGVKFCPSWDFLVRCHPCWISWVLRRRRRLTSSPSLTGGVHQMGLVRRIRFALHDLLKDPPFSRIDLISCRNLLIYLDREAQRRVFEIFHFALLEKGMLFLGSSESIEDAGTLFKTLDKKYRLYERRLGNRRSLSEGSPSLGFALAPRHSIPVAGIVENNFASATQPGPLSPATFPTSSRSWTELHFRFLERFAPPSVIVEGRAGCPGIPSGRRGRAIRNVARCLANAAC
jgi:hypothetical protein